MIAPDLLAAYRATQYVVQGESESITVRIDQTSTSADRLLQAHGVVRGAIVTAWNPGSRESDPALNRARTLALKRETRSGGWAFLPMTAEAQEPAWTEQGLLILGIGETEARAIGANYRQNAIVILEIGAAARLVDLTGP
jgi:hypothetical protein